MILGMHVGKLKGTFMRISRFVMAILLPSFLFALQVCFADAATSQTDYSHDPAFAGHAINPEYLHKLVENGYIPTRPPMSDMELVEKLNLDLPQLAGVKAAVEKKDAAALQAA